MYSRDYRYSDDDTSTVGHRLRHAFSTDFDISPGAQCDPISNVCPKGLRPGTYSWWVWNMGMGILKFRNSGMHQGAPLKMPEILTLISNLRPSKIPSLYERF